MPYICRNQKDKCYGTKKISGHQGVYRKRDRVDMELHYLPRQFPQGREAGSVARYQRDRYRYARQLQRVRVLRFEYVYYER